MGLLGFMMGLGKSQEEKMAIFVLEKAQIRMGQMEWECELFHNVLKNHPEQRGTILNIVSSAIICHFMWCVQARTRSESALDFLMYVSQNLRNGVESCFSDARTIKQHDNMNPLDLFEEGCALWLMKTIAPYCYGDDIVKRAIGDAYITEGNGTRSDVAEFCQKFNIREDRPPPR